MSAYLSLAGACVMRARSNPAVLALAKAENVCHGWFKGEPKTHMPGAAFFVVSDSDEGEQNDAESVRGTVQVTVIAARLPVAGRLARAIANALREPWSDGDGSYNAVRLMGAEQPDDEINAYVVRFDVLAQARQEAATP